MEEVFLRPKKKIIISENCLKVRDLVAVGSPASCELQQHSPATGREQLAIISWRGKKKNNPNVGKKDAFGGAEIRALEVAAILCESLSVVPPGSGGRTYFQSGERIGKKKKERTGVQRKPTERNIGAPLRLLQLFTPDFTSLSASLRSQRLTDSLTDRRGRKKMSGIRGES